MVSSRGEPSPKRMRTRSMTDMGTIKVTESPPIALELMYACESFFAKSHVSSSLMGNKKCTTLAQIIGHMAEYVGVDESKNDVGGRSMDGETKRSRILSLAPRGRSDDVVGEMLKRKAAIESLLIRKNPENRARFRLRKDMTPEETQDHLQHLLTGQIVEAVGPLLSVLVHHRDNKEVFNRPVDPVLLDIPDYFSIIKNPMDLGTIRRKLHDGGYSTLEQFAEDVRLVFANAMKFNRPSHCVYKRASTLLQVFEHAFEKLKAKCAIRYGYQHEHSCDFCDHGALCPLCMRKCRALQPPTLSCEVCQTRITPRSYYYCEEGSTRVRCPKCRNRKLVKGTDPKDWFAIASQGAAAASEKPAPSVVPSAVTSARKMKRCYNGLVSSEAWVTCANCSTKYHQACVLYNPWRSDATFVCLRCRLTDTNDKDDDRKEMPSLQNLPRASNLPRTPLSDFVEARLRRAVASAYQRRESSCAAANSVNSTFALREVSCSKRKLAVPHSFRQAMCFAFPQFQDAYPAFIGHKDRTIHLYQRIDGVDVLIFALYVSEFGSDAPVSNRGSAYISYLDSVHFMRPQFLRTTVYHTILSGYLAHLKERGFTNVHIWACPPMRSADYIFNCHPRSQRTPGWERLRVWYNTMIRKAHAEGSVVDVGTLYHDHFDRRRGVRPKRTKLPPPFFSRHFWLKQLASAVAASTNPLTCGPVALRLRRRRESQSTTNAPTRSSPRNERKKRQRLARSAILDSLAKRLAPMAERLLVVRLQPLCRSCCAYIQANENHAWMCNEVRSDEASLKRKRKGNATADPNAASAEALINAPSFFCEACVDAIAVKGTSKKAAARKLATSLGCEGPISLWERPAKERKTVASCVVDTESANPAIDRRLAFLAFCAGNHLQFDSLRHAKFSSMLILHLLFEGRASSVGAFVRYCNLCHLPVRSKERWHCTQCLDFDVCATCLESRGGAAGAHHHPLEKKRALPLAFQIRSQPVPDRPTKKKKKKTR